jgi:integrase
MAELMYGSGIRLMELLRLRVHHLDLDRGQLTVRSGKRDKDRITIIPQSLNAALTRQFERLRLLHGEDIKAGLPGVWLPEGLAKKYQRAGERWEWQWFFPSREAGLDSTTGITRRHHTSDNAFQNAVRKAAARAGINKRVTPHVFRHCDLRSPLRCASGPALNANRGLTISARLRSVVRHAPPGERVGHPHRAGTPGAR